MNLAPPAKQSVPVRTATACCQVSDPATQNPCALCSKLTCSACRSLVNANGVCASCFAQIGQEMDREKAAASHTVGAILGGAVGALVGGAGWALISIATGLNIGYVAIGVGYLAGIGVYLGAGKRKGVQLQAIAIGCALLGLLLGKYFIVAHVLITSFPEANLSYVDGRLMQVFGENVGEFVQAFDILWVLLALGAARQVTRPTQAVLQPAQPPR